MSAPDLGVLAGHLFEETDALLGALDAAGDAAYGLATPSPGWRVADQISHLAYFDGAQSASLRGLAAFAPYRAEALELGASLCDAVAARYAGRTPAALREGLVTARSAMVAAMREAGPSARVPWYGPDFSVASALSGRIMETWAHGQDVYDALGVAHPVTAALYDVTRLCARTRVNSYVVHGRVAPEGAVGVEVTAPDGTLWRFGEGAGELVRGDAVELCLVATQRRHRADTRLEATGPLAEEWLSLAQAFAGPPGEGRAAEAQT